MNSDRDSFASCDLWGGTTILDRTSASTLNQAAELGDVAPFEAVALVGIVAFPQGGTVELTCETTDDGVEAFDTKILAIKVSTMN